MGAGVLGLSLSALLLVATIGLLVSSNVYADLAIKLTKLELLTSGIPAQYISILPIEIFGKIGFYQPFMLCISIVLAIASAVVGIIKRKQA